MQNILDLTGFVIMLWIMFVYVAFVKRRTFQDAVLMLSVVYMLIMAMKHILQGQIEDYASQVVSSC